MSEELILRTENICKSFNGIQVLKNVNLEIRKGEIHALMGENGAGKSTIIKIITGVYTKDDGEIYIDGQHVVINNRHDAAEAGISVIYQELSLVPELTVTENIFLGHEIMKRGLPDKKEMRRQVQALIDRYGFLLRPDEVVATMGMAQRQMCEILKALSTEAKLLIMDEPTTSLSASETEQLFVTMEGLREKGTSILYISHRLEEIYRVTDRLTIMRNGEVVGVVDSRTVQADTVTAMMIGHELEKTGVRVPNVNHDHCIEVKDLSLGNLLHNVSFKIREGEFVSITGLWRRDPGYRRPGGFRQNGACELHLRSRQELQGLHHPGREAREPQRGKEYPGGLRYGAGGPEDGGLLPPAQHPAQHRHFQLRPAQLPGLCPRRG